MLGLCACLACVGPSDAVLAFHNPSALPHIQNSGVVYGEMGKRTPCQSLGAQAGLTKLTEEAASAFYISS